MKHIVKQLGAKKFSKQDNIWIYGVHPAKEILLSDKRKIKQILISDKLYERFLSDAKLKQALSNNVCKKIHPKDFVKILKQEVTHQGIAIEIENPKELSLQDFLTRSDEVKKLVILDQITDVGNVGAIIRSAIAFGIKDLFVTEFNSVSDYALIAKASSGLSEKINIYKVTNLNKLIDNLQAQEFWCVGLDGSARASITEAKKFEKIALILGSEGKGIRDLVKKNCDLLVKIPMSSEAESLNVSNAAAISFFTIFA